VGALAAAGQLVTTTEELQRALGAVRDSGIIGIDTEFMREKTYRAKLCLVQFSADEDVWLLDPLSTVSLAPLGEVVGEPAIKKVVHAGKQDLEIFYETFNVVPANVYDVQVAAAFAGYGASLAYGRLVSAALGVSLTKGESYTDWCRRPLTDAQLRYAADDVRYLIPLYDKLTKALTEAGRLDWIDDEFAELGDEETYRFDPASVWKKVGGRGSLTPRQTAVLREVARWREETAMKRDLPRGWIVKDATLIDVARRAPSSLGELKSVRGMNAREVERGGQEILAAIEKGRRGEPVDKASSPPRTVQARARMVSGLADAVVRARCERAGLATELVATRSELENLLTEVFDGRLNERSHRILQGWRRELAGDAVVDLAEGKLAVRVLNDPPYVEEVYI